MNLRLRLTGSMACVLSAACIGAVFADEATPVDPSRANSPGAVALAALVDAFNKHDAQAMATAWKTDGVLVVESGATKFTARDAIAKAYDDLFKSNPNAKLAIHLIDERSITPQVVSIRCYADVLHSNKQVTRSAVNAILVEHDGKWLIDQAEETEIAPPDRAASRLSQLGWFSGQWTDKLPDGQVTNDIHSSDNGHCIVRNYRQEEKGVATREGTQIIAWDPRHQALRAWLFDASGAFGEGVWRQDAPNQWTNTMAVVLPDGRRASMTQLFERTPDDKLMIQTIDRDVDGAPQPNSEVVSLERVGGAPK